MWRRFEALPRVRSSLASHAESQRNQHKRTLFAQPANNYLQWFAVFRPHWTMSATYCSVRITPALIAERVRPYREAAVTLPLIRKSLPVRKLPSRTMSSAPTVPTSSGVPARRAVASSIMRRYPSPRGRVSSSFARGVVSLRSVRLLNPPGWLSSHVASRPLVAGESNPVQRRLGIAAS